MTNLVFFGHHKCASTWMSNIFYEIQSVTGWTIKYGIDPSKKINVIGEATAEHAKTYTEFRGVHLIRDPRDVIVSGYYSHLNTHPTEKRPDILEFRNQIKDLPLNEGIKMEMDFSSERLLEMAKWDYSNPNILELRFEEFTQNPDWSEIFTFLNLTSDQSSNYRLKKFANKLNNRKLFPSRFNELTVPRNILNDIPQKYSFKKMSGGREKGETSVNSHYRTGESGQWQKIFNREHRTYFKEKFPGLISKLGYDTDEDW